MQGDVASESRAARVFRSLVCLLPKVQTTRSLKLFCLQFPIVVIATKSDIIKERECDSTVIKKWAEAEKGIFYLFYLFCKVLYSTSSSVYFVTIKCLLAPVNFCEENRIDHNSRKLSLRLQINRGKLTQSYVFKTLNCLFVCFFHLKVALHFQRQGNCITRL